MQTADKTLSLYNILEGAAGLIVMASRIEDAMIKQSLKDDVRIPRKEMYALAKINRLNAAIIDDLVYTVERQIEHIKNMEAMIKILKAKG